MCLTIIYTGREKKRALAKLPESGYYWKAINKRKGKYYPICQCLPGGKPFKNGWNQTKYKCIDGGCGDRVAFHLHGTKKAAATWSGLTVRCKVDKKDIIAIGEQFGELEIVTTRFWIPKPRSYKRSK